MTYCIFIGSKTDWKKDGGSRRERRGDQEEKERGDQRTKVRSLQRGDRLMRNRGLLGWVGWKVGVRVWVVFYRGWNWDWNWNWDWGWNWNWLGDVVGG